jgi:Barrel-sandwich domain of CusB or HlyD membrane-fusion/GAF domain
MPSESTGINQTMEQALRDLAELRVFQGPARDFWPRFVSGVGNLIAANKVTILVRQQSDPSAPPTWRKVGEWSATGGASRILVAFTSQLETVAERCASHGSALFPLEPVPARGAGHFVVAIRLTLARNDEPCVASCLMSEVNDATAREGLLRLGLTADVPASYQVNLAGQQARSDVQKFASALDLMAQVNVEKRFLAAALALCNGLATHFQCDRVSLGWLEAGYVRLRAISRTEKFDRQMAAARALEIAMEECLDQDDEVQFPAPEGSTVVTRDHAQFVADQKAGHVCSLPVRLDQKAVAVLTCERQAAGFSDVELQQLRLVADQIARRLGDLKHHDRWFGARWATTTKEFCGKLVGPEHTWAKVLAVLITILLAVFFFLKVDYRVEGNFLLKSDDVAFLTAPFDGYISRVLARPGDLVKKGTDLLRLDTADLELEESAALADLNRYRSEAEKARAAESLAEMRIALSLAAQAQSRLDLVQHRLSQAAVKSPFSGVVAEGDLRERLGAPVKQGDALFKVARIDTLYVEAEISERDVHEILGRSTGEIAFVSQPKLKYPIRIERIEPAAFPKNNGNVFVVRCSFLQGPESWWRPGMSGLCKLNVEKRTLVWIFTHRTVDFLRMMLWW